MKIQSNKESLTTPQEKVFNTLVGFTQQAQVPPIPQISNWNADENGCSFTIENMVTCQLKITDQVPYSKICYHIDTDKGFAADAIFHIDGNESGSSIQLEAEADVPIFLQPMIKGPIEQAVNMALAKIKEMAERS